MPKKHLPAAANNTQVGLWYQNSEFKDAKAPHAAEGNSRGWRLCEGPSLQAKRLTLHTVISTVANIKIRFSSTSITLPLVVAQPNVATFIWQPWAATVRPPFLWSTCNNNILRHYSEQVPLSCVRDVPDKVLCLVKNSTEVSWMHESLCDKLLMFPFGPSLACNEKCKIKKMSLESLWTAYSMRWPN